MEFKDILKETRLNKGLTQHAVSAACGVPDSTYQKWERGAIEPTLQSILKLCKALDIEPNNLLSPLL